MTALRAASGGRVEIDLDGTRWRIVPAEVVYNVGLAVGAQLDRQRARTIGRELRRLRALDLALRTLRRRDHTAAELEQRLLQRGVAPAERERALSVLDGAGLVDDMRFAADRAALLVTRGAGDLLVVDDLERRGIAPEIVQQVVGDLEPERDRVTRIAATRGSSVRTLRALAAKGFSEGALEALVAQLENGA